jgi:hypothetical protein
MRDNFKNLNQHEYSQLMDTIPLITILIAGADGTIDRQELDFAEKVTAIRSYKMYEQVMGLYQDVDMDFKNRIQHFIDTLPKDLAQREEAITSKLTDLNSIIEKLDPLVAYKLVKSFKSFARRVAEAEGGILGFFSINKAEARLIDLPMIHPIEHNEEEE